MQSLAANGVITPGTAIESENGRFAIAGNIEGLTFISAQSPSQPVSAVPAPPVTASPSAPVNVATSNADSLPPPSTFREPAPGESLAALVGVGALLKIFDDKIVIQKETQGSKSLFFNRLTSTQFSAAQIGLPGFLQFTFAGSSDLQGTGSQAVLSSIADENSFVFLGFQQNLVEAIRDFVDAKIGGIDIQKERNILLSHFTRYTEEIKKLHYTLVGHDGTTLEIYGDFVNIDGNNIYYSSMLCASSMPQVLFSFREAKLPGPKGIIEQEFDFFRALSTQSFVPRLLNAFKRMLNPLTGNPKMIAARLLFLFLSVRVPLLHKFAEFFKKDLKGRLMFFRVSPQSTLAILFEQDQNNEATEIANYLIDTIGLKRM